jgi:hypothetical protein
MSEPLASSFPVQLVWRIEALKSPIVAKGIFASQPRIESRCAVTEDLFETYSANSPSFDSSSNCGSPQRSAFTNEGGWHEAAE